MESTSSLPGCRCCYCGHVQEVPAPPALVDCVQCGHGFRVLRNEGQKSMIELTEAARDLYAQKGAA